MHYCGTKVSVQMMFAPNVLLW